jgi:2-C-methyl-D-erythritol 2,4-cyclodiphosphate synthase
MHALTPSAPHPPFRIGQGWDTHALIQDRPLILGGVHIPHTHGLLGHSDADALCHAIIDALLGAAALGDIGQHFPDTDECFRNADSKSLLQEAARRVAQTGWQIGNIDSIIVTQRPKLQPYILNIRESLAQALSLQLASVSVKAKTAEKMGPVGREESLETHAVCVLYR